MGASVNFTVAPWARGAICFGFIDRSSLIEATSNGKPAWEVDDFKAKKGPLGIEAEGHAIDFRNLRIKVINKKE